MWKTNPLEEINESYEKLIIQNNHMKVNESWKKMFKTNKWITWGGGGGSYENKWAVWEKNTKIKIHIACEGEVIYK